ncbi:cytochrome P450/oxidoreductase [Curvibacter delicatus]|jgi:cytochrome P450/NAD(P)H-flavin reductase/ferredoxin|uniref:cytochrome P450/oxidoreductase n=1 Tax=Curvibacter delicatus TaxID=80879 RepID=UPI000830EFA0|nr:cytochrome P450/oxidoreductase [Curvibacter delicatus]
MNSSSAAAIKPGCPIDHKALTGLQAPNGCPISQRAAEFDPFEDAYQQDPPEYVRWAREQEPVFYSPKLGYWVVTRYDDIKAIFRDNITFSPSIALEKITPTSQEANDVLASYNYAMNRTLVNEDEPAHMARRRVLMEPFTPEALKHHEPMVRQVTREYVDRFINDGKADLVDQMLWEVPLTIALHFLGVPEEDMDTLRQYSIAHTVNTWGRPKPEEQIKVAHAVGNFWQLAGKILDKMRKDPSGPGWMRYGIRKQAEYPDVVTDSYLHSMMMAGIVAAHETTANATANAVKLLLQHPSAWRDICEDPGLIPNAVEECIRYNGSVAAWRRLATKDTRIGDIDISAGSRLLIVMSSANHDGRHFEDPDLFDIRRDNSSEHLTFGYGSHQCMGKNLARLELQIFLEELTKRLPHMRLSPQKFTYVPNTSFRGPEHLWVEWDPTLNPERVQPAILQQQATVRMGEPSRHAISRTVVVDEVRQVATDILHLRLKSPDGSAMPRWTPGSHIDVECGTPDLSRQYSLCGDPADSSVLEIAVLKDPDSRGGSRWLHEDLQRGDKLKIRGPRNHFRFDESTKKAIFIAGGIGITPVATMARRAKELGIDYELHYSGRSRDTMAFLDELSQLHGTRLQVYAKDEGQRNDFGRLLGQPQEGTQVYACGPVRMLESLESCCEKWPEDALRVEHFQSTRSTLDPEKEHAFEVELKDSGLLVKVPANQTLLTALRSANIDIQSDCGEGLCGSCEVKVLSGQVDHRDVVLTRSEREANNKMMACCSRAAGMKLILEL